MQRRHFLGLVGAGVLGASRPLAASTMNSVPSTLQVDPQFDEISRLIETKMAEYRVTGVALGISKNGVSQSRGFGITNVDNPQAVTTDTVFAIASISKTVAATALMRLHDQGRIDVEAPVSAYLPTFAVADADATKDVKIWHLMTHTPGWEGQLDFPDRGPETSANFIETLREIPQLARPGEVWAYNNAGWGVAGRVIEVVTGSNISDALHSLVFEPLGLDRAFSRTGDATSYRFAAGHGERDGRTVVARPFYQFPPTVGGCAMSIENLLRFAEFHLGDGTTTTGERLLTTASLELMRTPRIQKNSSTDEMGLGWHLRTLDGVLTAQHGGTLEGHSLHVQLVPARNLGFALLTNHRNGEKLNEDVATVILDTYEELALAPGQRTGGNRGGSERMTHHAEPLVSQPPLDEYLGVYERAPIGRMTVREEGGRLVVEAEGWGANDQYPLVFWAPDMAYAAEPGSDPSTWAAFPGMAVEFIRDASGAVTWIRENGRIARKEGR